jgi:hypothetical protein
MIKKAAVIMMFISFIQAPLFSEEKTTDSTGKKYVSISIDPIAMDNIITSLESDLDTTQNYFSHIRLDLNITNLVLINKSSFSLICGLGEGGFDLNYYLFRNYIYYNADIGLALKMKIGDYSPMQINISTNYLANNSSPFVELAEWNNAANFKINLWHDLINKASSKMWHELLATGLIDYSTNFSGRNDISGSFILKYILRDTEFVESTYMPWFSISTGIDYNRTIYYDNITKITLPIELIIDRKSMQSLNGLGINLNNTAIGFKLGYQISPIVGFDSFSVFFSGNQ